jgi:peptidoglycan/xylan/chitin deacetylase (PgdA/CDA1 family)
MDRRSFLLALTIGTAVAVSACDTPLSRRAAQAGPPGGPPAPVPSGLLTAGAGDNWSAFPPDAPTGSTGWPSARPTAGAPTTSRPYPPGIPAAAPGRPRILDQLPGPGRTVALTVDDGTSSAVLGAYAHFAAITGTRITFFVNGFRPSWTEHAAVLRPMIDSGQIQVANHTWDHPDITRLSSADLISQVTRNERFLNDTYGVTGRPFFRPPFGYRNARTDDICAQLGYTDITMWYGSLGDSSVLTPAQVLANARRWLQAQRIVIGHANHPAVTAIYPDLVELLRDRSLTTVTLNDAFAATRPNRQVVTG